MLKIKKLNSAGFVHHTMLAMLLVVIGVAGFGTYKIVASKADSFSSRSGASSLTAASRLSASSASRAQPKYDGHCEDNLHRHHNDNGNCTSCFDAYYDADNSGHGACSPKNCDQPHDRWNAAQNRCGCDDNYHLQDGTTNVCNPNQTSNGGGGSTGGGGGGGSGGNNGQGKTKSDCDNLHRSFNSGNSSCGDCWNDWYDADHSGHGACSNKNCHYDHNVWNGTDNSCHCEQGWYIDANHLCHPLNTGTTKSTGTNGSGSGGGHGNTGSGSNNNTGTTHTGGTNTTSNPGTASTGGNGNGNNQTSNSNGNSKNNQNNNLTPAKADAKRECNVYKHRIWNDNSQSCGSQCAQDYDKAIDGTCVPGNSTCQGIIADDGSCVGKKDVKQYCAAHFLIYNDKVNSCKTECIKNYSKGADGSCGKTGVDQTKDPSTLTVDPNVGRRLCATLGLQWEPGTKNDNKQVVKGCVMNKCDNDADSVVANSDGLPYCTDYIAKIDNATCTHLHRNWIAEANGCQQNPKQATKAGTTKINQPACDKQHTTYVFEEGDDKCTTASGGDKVKGALQTTTKPIKSVGHFVQNQACNANPKKHSTGTKCVDDKPGKSVNTGGNDNEQTKPQPNATQVNCEKNLHRKFSNGICVGANSTGTNTAVCASGYSFYLWMSSPTAYDKCVSSKPADLCTNNAYGNKTALCPTTPKPTTCPTGQTLTTEGGYPHCVSTVKPASCPAGQTMTTEGGYPHCVKPAPTSKALSCQDYVAGTTYAATATPSANCKLIRNGTATETASTKYYCDRLYGPYAIHGAKIDPVTNTTYSSYYCL